MAKVLIELMDIVHVIADAVNSLRRVDVNVASGPLSLCICWRTGARRQQRERTQQLQIHGKFPLIG